MRITHQIVVLDASDVDTESSFWAGVLGGTVEAADDWHQVSVDGVPRLAVQYAPDHVPRRWREGSPQQMHLDLWVDDIDAAHRLVMVLGGRLLKEADGGDRPDGYQIYADPAGHPFCLCWMRE